MATRMKRAVVASRPETAAVAPRKVGLLAYLLVGIYFGIVLTKSQIVSWFRIQEMFRLQGFYMYGIFMTAVPTAAVLIALVKRRGRALNGEPIVIPPKEVGAGIRYVVGGGVFGVGMALTGACPGPQFALLGAGAGAIGVMVLSAIAGAWVYGYLRPRLPH